MVRFAHIADVHLGGWKQQPMQDLNFKSFQMAVQKCIEQRVEFVLIVGDLFDSAYPPIEVLKDTFAEFRKLKQAKIPCFIVAGSHDYSVSGKTFLDVLEKAGFCTNVHNTEEVSENDETILLKPVIYNGVALYGYPGKKSGLEIPELRKVKLNESPGMFKIFMLHTTIDKAKGTLPIDALETTNIAEADYYALGHLHIDFRHGKFVYPGPIFPNNFQELEDLRFGRFYIIDTDSGQPFERIELKIKEIEKAEFELTNGLTATNQIISSLEKRDLKDKIILLRLRGELRQGKHSDINYSKIEEFVKEKGAYFILKNTHNLKLKQEEVEIEIKEEVNIEEETIKVYSEENPSDFNKIIPTLINSLSIEKQEGETTENFNVRLLEDVRRVLGF